MVSFEQTAAPRHPCCARGDVVRERLRVPGHGGARVPPWPRGADNGGDNDGYDDYGGYGGDVGVRFFNIDIHT